MKKILTIQDISCYGQCSITVALPVLSSYGVETVILPSAILSTHTAGFKNMYIKDLTDDMLPIINHWEKENIKFDAVYTGYIANDKQFDIIYKSFDLLKDDAIKFVDPAFADNGKVYPALDPKISISMKKLCDKADYIIPNLTESCFMLGIDYKEDFTIEEVKKIAIKLNDISNKVVIITGINILDDVNVLIYENNKFDCLSKKRILKNFHGTGDIFSSVVLAGILTGKSTHDAVDYAMDFIIDSINNTLDKPNHDYGVCFEQTLNNKKM
ncbi:MAG: pyridoxamine kinase [Anaeroplasmataceae bacterium]